MRWLVIFLIAVVFIGAVGMIFFLFSFNKAEDQVGDGDITTPLGDSSAIKQGCDDENCRELLINSQDKEHSIDIIFIPSNMHYGEANGQYFSNSESPIVAYGQENFLADVNTAIEKLSIVEPYKTYFGKFNFYYYTQNVKCFANEWGSVVCGLDDNRVFSSDLQYLSEFGYFDLYYVMEPKEGGGAGGAVVVSSKDPMVVIHEISHRFGLFDESISYEQHSFDGKSKNVCTNFNCCGGALCSQEVIEKCNPSLGKFCSKEESGECCILTASDSFAYTVPYRTLMKYGNGGKDYLFSEASEKILDYKLQNWKDDYGFFYDEFINKTVYVPDFNRADISLEDLER
jgi:hypothetical protein